MNRLDRDFLRFAHHFSPECKAALLAGTAAVMPIKEVPIVHGPNEAYAPQRTEMVRWAEKSLHNRLDRR